MIEDTHSHHKHEGSVCGLPHDGMNRPEAPRFTWRSRHGELPTESPFKRHTGSWDTARRCLQRLELVLPRRDCTSFHPFLICFGDEQPHPNPLHQDTQSVSSLELDSWASLAAVAAGVGWRSEEGLHLKKQLEETTIYNDKT